MRTQTFIIFTIVIVTLQIATATAQQDKDKEWKQKKEWQNRQNKADDFFKNLMDKFKTKAQDTDKESIKDWVKEMEEKAKGGRGGRGPGGKGPGNLRGQGKDKMGQAGKDFEAIFKKINQEMGHKYAKLNKWDVKQMDKNYKFEDFDKQWEEIVDNVRQKRKGFMERRARTQHKGKRFDHDKKMYEKDDHYKKEFKDLKEEIQDEFKKGEKEWQKGTNKDKVREFYKKIEGVMKKKIEGDADMPQKVKDMYVMETEMMVKELKAEIEGDSFEHFFAGLQDKFKSEFRKTRGHGKRGKKGERGPTEDEEDEAMDEINGWFGNMKEELEEKYKIDSKEMVKQVKKLKNKKWSWKDSRGQKKRRERGKGHKKGGKGILGKMESLLDTDDMEQALGEGPDHQKAPARKWVWLCGVAFFAGLMWYLVKVFKKRHAAGPGGNNVVQGEVVNYDNISFE